MGDQNSASGSEEIIDEIERREVAAAPAPTSDELIERREEAAAAAATSDELIEGREEAAPTAAAPMTSCSARMRRSSLNDERFSVQTKRKRTDWPNDGALLRWTLIDRFRGSRDPEAAAEKAWRRHEKRLRRAQLKDAPPNKD